MFTLGINGGGQKWHLAHRHAAKKEFLLSANAQVVNETSPDNMFYI